MCIFPGLCPSLEPEKLNAYYFCVVSIDICIFQLLIFLVGEVSSFKDSLEVVLHKLGFNSYPKNIL